MEYWPSSFDLIQLYENYCKEHGVEHEAFEQRVVICKLYQELDSMRYFAKVNNKPAYDASVQLAEKVYAEI